MIADMILSWFLDMVILHMCCLFLVLKAHCSRVMSFSYKIVRLVLILAFTHLDILSTLLMIIYQKYDCVNISVPRVQLLLKYFVKIL